MAIKSSNVTARMAIGFVQARFDESASADELFARLMGEIKDGNTGKSMRLI